MSNVSIDVHEHDAIAMTLQTALKDNDFRSRCASAVNPYGDGRSGPRICEILSTIPLDGRLMDKVTTF